MLSQLLEPPRADNPFLLCGNRLAKEELLAFLLVKESKLVGLGGLIWICHVGNFTLARGNEHLASFAFVPDYVWEVSGRFPLHNSHLRCMGFLTCHVGTGLGFLIIGPWQSSPTPSSMFKTLIPTILLSKLMERTP